MANRKQRPSRSNRENLLASVFLDDNKASFYNDGDPNLYYEGLIPLTVPGQQYANPLSKGKSKTLNIPFFDKNRKQLIIDLLKNSGFLKGVQNMEAERLRKHNDAINNGKGKFRNLIDYSKYE